MNNVKQKQDKFKKTNAGYLNLFKTNLKYVATQIYNVLLAITTSCSLNILEVRLVCSEHINQLPKERESLRCSLPTLFILQWQ